LSQLINKLQSSIIAYEKEQNQTQAYFTDYRYFRKNDDQSRNHTRPPESTKGPTLHDTVEHVGPARIDEPTLPPQDATPQPVPKRGRGRPHKYPLLTAIADITIYLQDSATQFSASRQKELAGLLEKGVFEITKLADVPQGVRLFNSRFVDEIKNPGTDKAFEKSRLVVQAYND
jgi:hypothetical protein